VAALLRKELGVNVETTGGKTGEFTVWVGGQLVARKGWIRFPSDQKVLEAVRTALNTDGQTTTS
jgi:hypothetical protein